MRLVDSVSGSGSLGIGRLPPILVCKQQAIRRTGQAGTGWGRPRKPWSSGSRIASDASISTLYVDRCQGLGKLQDITPKFTPLGSSCHVYPYCPYGAPIDGDRHGEQPRTPIQGRRGGVDGKRAGFLLNTRKHTDGDPIKGAANGAGASCFCAMQTTAGGIPAKSPLVLPASCCSSPLPG